MGDGTSIGKFNGLTTAGGGVFFDVGTPARNVGFLIRDTAPLGGDPGALIGNPDTLNSNTDALSFDPDALSFDVFHQRLDSNGLISSHLRIFCKNSRKMVGPRCGRAALLRGLGRPAGRPYHGTVSAKPSKFAFPNFQLLTPNCQ